MSTENKFEWTDVLVAEYSLTNQKMTLFEFKRFIQEREKSKQQNTIPVGKKFEDDYDDLGNGRYRHKAQQNTIQKDWEIVSVEDGVKNGSYSKGKIVFIESEDERSWIKSNIKIHSVKRLSDGEVFSIGDDVKWRNFEPTKILGFEFIGESDYFAIAGNKESLELKEYLDSLKKELRVRVSPLNGITRYFLFSGISKVKQPLFKTEDGIDVYEGDRYYVVIEKDGFGYETFAVAWHGQGGIESANYKNAAKFFSDKGKANEYILMNKPVLSVNDIMKAAPLMGKYYEDGIKGLAKSKIEGK
jgi:hypothetical protein